MEIVLYCIFVAFFCHFVLLLIKIPGIVLCCLCCVHSYIHLLNFVCVVLVWCMYSVIICNICIGILAGHANFL